MLLRYMKVLAALGILILGSQLGYAETSSAKQNPITAIDIALEPDATMIQHAEAVNARLRKAFPKGFALDATHHPHVSILQRYVHTADLDKVYDAGRQGPGRREGGRLEPEGVQVLLHPMEGHWPCGHCSRADRRFAQAATKFNRRSTHCHRGTTAPPNKRSSNSCRKPPRLVRRISSRQRSALPPTWKIRTAYVNSMTP